MLDDDNMISYSDIIREFVKQKITEDDPQFEEEVENYRNRFRFDARIKKMQFEQIDQASLENHTAKSLGPKAKERFFDKEFSTEFVKFLIMGESEALHPSSYRKFVNGKLKEVSEENQGDWLEVIESFMSQLSNSIGSATEKSNAFTEFIFFYQLNDLYFSHYESIIYSEDELNDLFDS